MKKQYIKPTTEVVAIDPAALMVPNQQSGPGFSSANSYAFEEEEEEPWDKLDNSTGHVWD